ncbi:unnamed protein product [Lepeophtheirus salmonis]|uniref:(salmon louse) hypothetical protein n=1 Tax=Lepeophtheirus salmonis TaxID=72036 RepID=A0A7R8H7X5_LEPSM|nr:unnamed protein product [Lepeophtheirus salmonis]CAF2927111.1 unnamed protein product [Lepeophtheirus salmonis]
MGIIRCFPPPCGGFDCNRKHVRAELRSWLKYVYSENSQEIQTTNEDPCKTIKGVKCRFPAIYGKTYYSCISSIDESKTWCYTDIEENWDFCDQTTCFACGRNTQNRPCDDGYVGTKIEDDIIIPWFAILVYSYTYKYSVKKPIYVRCGATILNQNWLISSVACFFFQNGRKAVFGEMEAIMGTYVVDKIGIPTITTKIKDVVTIEESISLYKLEKPIQHYTSFMSPLLSKSMEEDNIHSTPIMKKIINNPKLPEEEIVILKELESLHSLCKEHFLENDPQEEEIDSLISKIEFEIPKRPGIENKLQQKSIEESANSTVTFIPPKKSIVQFNVRSLINKFKGDPEDENVLLQFSNWKTA